jgi:hypothetical protein
MGFTSILALKRQRLKNVLISGVIGASVILGGCGNSVNYDIPDDAVAITDINENTYSNPNDSEDTYGCVEIDGVTYVIFGTQGTTITDQEIGSCIAYSKTDSNERFYEVKGSHDFIASYYVHGVMSQFDFLRSVDTIGVDIDIPDFIDSLGYEIWN